MFGQAKGRQNGCDRAVYARKFAARLAEYGIPYYFYEVTEGGHGAGANIKEQARTTALMMTYFSRKLMDK